MLTPQEIVSQSSWAEIDPELIPHFLLTLWWSENFLTRHQADLGRAGPTCPFVRASLDKETFWLTAVKDSNPDRTQFETLLLGYRDWFLELEPAIGDDSQYKTILILLPNVAPKDYSTIIEGTQVKLKPEFVEQELMIGQFHPLCEEPGVRNPSFRPLKSPVPLLAIRKIAAGDIVFMKAGDGRYDQQYLRSYLEVFAKGLPHSFIAELTKVMAENGYDHPATTDG